MSDETNNEHPVYEYDVKWLGFNLGGGPPTLGDSPARAGRCPRRGHPGGCTLSLAETFKST